ncbi:MAG: hypothetical protein R3B47_06260 [Bacteroidia bacterium]
MMGARTGTFRVGGRRPRRTAGYNHDPNSTYVVWDLDFMLIGFSFFSENGPRKTPPPAKGLILLCLIGIETGAVTANAGILFIFPPKAPITSSYKSQVLILRASRW